MRGKVLLTGTLVIFLAGVLQPIDAFTKGTMLPPYLCGPANDGYPKAVSTLLPYLKLGTAISNYDNFPIGNGTIQITPQTVGATSNAHPSPASWILGSFHNGAKANNYTKGTLNPVVLVPSTANTTTGDVGNFVITPGANHSFAFVVNAISYNNANEALDGAFAYAMDTGTGQRVGQWINAGTMFSTWPACMIGTNAVATGIVHNMVINTGTNIAGLIWQAPKTITGTIKFIGAGVTDGGYGAFSVEFNTTTTKTAPPISTTVRANATLANTGAFAQKDVAADYVFTQNVVLTATTTTTGVTQGAAAGIAIACGVVGIAAGFFIFVGVKKRGMTSSGGATAAGTGNPNKAPLLL